MTRASIETRALTSSDWELVERLFGDKGACGGCWCMYWRVPSTGKYWQQHKGAKNKKAFKTLVESGRATGVLALQGEAPVGWCSVGPRADFAYFARARKIPPPRVENTWSVTCFYIARALRRCGVAGELLAAAVGLARAERAAYVEGYPVNVVARAPDAFAYTGVPALFERAGFSRRADAGARVVYGLKL